MHVQGWDRCFHVVLGVTQGLAKLGMEVIQMSLAISGASHEVDIVLDGFIFIPFGVGCKEPVFVNALSNIQSSQFGFKCECDWNLVLSHPLIVQTCEATLGRCSGEDTFMANFKETRTAEFVACRFTG